MKNIFKKNQIIITALAIMIVIAGYLSFTNRDNKKDQKELQTMEQDAAVSKKDKLTEKMSGKELATATTNDITGAANDTTNGTTNDTTNANVTVTVTPKDAGNQADELGDISDDDILKTAKNVTDKGEIENKDKSVPGEAVLASTTLESGFFSSKKLEREQLRANNKDTLMDIIQSTKISEADKKEATKKLLELTENAEKENATELLLEAKGFDGAIVCINDGKAEVVINAANITDQQLAIIENVVKTKTQFDVKNISINPVVVNE